MPLTGLGVVSILLLEWLLCVLAGGNASTGSRIASILLLEWLLYVLAGQVTGVLSPTGIGRQLMV